MSPSIALIGVPAIFFAAALLSFIPFGRAFAKAVTVVAAAAALLLSGLIAARVMHSGSLAALRYWIGIGGFGALLLLLVSFVALLASLFSWGYMGARARERSDASLRLYHVNLNLFLFSIVIVPMMEEVALTWIAVELTTLLSVMLVAFDDTREALEAAWKYVILTMIGAAVAVLGVIILYRANAEASGGAFTWNGLIQAAPRLSPVLLKGGFLLLLLGFGVKVGLVPMHTWLPDAHSQAPSPVCAILSGVETSTILFVILRLFPVVAAQPDIHAQDWAMVFGLVSVGVAAFLLIQVRDLKRLFAFSTVEHMGIILFAAGVGSGANAFVVPYQMFTHALAKPLCFFAAGAALVTMGTREIAALKGLARREPLAGGALLVGGLAVTGAPPFALFLSELSIVRAGIGERAYLAVGLLVLFVVIAFAAVLHHLNRIVFGRAEATLESGAQRLPAVSLVALALAIVPVLLFGVWIPQPLHELLTLAGTAVGGTLP